MVAVESGSAGSEESLLSASALRLAVDRRRSRGVLSFLPLGRPGGPVVRAGRDGSNREVFSDQVRPVQMSRTVFSLMP